MTITDDEIKAARALCEAATPGPWTARFDEYVIGDNVSARVSIRNDDGAWVDSERTIVNESMRGDAAFIAASRTLVPRLLDEVERLKAAQVKHEVEIYSARCARYPENLTWRYELALRLKAAGNHAEAIRHFQEVLQDPRRKGAVSLDGRLIDYASIRQAEVLVDKARQIAAH